MDALYINTATLVYSICLLLSCTRQIHMLQLSSYRNRRYIAWLKENHKKEHTVLEAFVLVGPALLLSWQVWRFAAVFAVALVAALIALPHHKQKKKLVYTARVKRLYAVLILICLAFFGAANLLYAADRPFLLFIFFTLLGVLFILRFAAVLAANTLALPLERLVARGYTKSAVKKLRGMKNLTVIGITGSYGKTSTKYILSRILSEKYNVLMTPESYNTPMGVVRTIRERLLPTHEIFIVEMGAKQRGDIKEICDIVRPRHGIITSVGPCHLESFGSVETVADTKFELFEALPEGGLAVLNFDSEMIKNRQKSRPFISYSTGAAAADYTAGEISCSQSGMSFELKTKTGQTQRLLTKLLGAMGAANITAAAALALELGVSKEQLAFAVSALSPIPHRLELKNHGNGYIVIDDAFNSNPAGAAEALRVLGSFEKSFKVLVTPGIVELGGAEEELNTQLGTDAAAAADFVIAVGQRAQYIARGLEKAGFSMENCFIAGNLDDALARLEKFKKANMVVLFENDLPDNMENTAGRNKA